MIRITVIGDLILDRYWHGWPAKLNPEAPGYVYRVDSISDRVGGAAAVGMLASRMGATVTIAGVMGDDPEGRDLLRLLREHGVKSDHVVVNRHWVTTTKHRIVADGRLLPDRFDREITDSIPGKIEQLLAATPLGEIVLLQDYGKGVCTPALVRALVNRGVQIVVDPAPGKNWAQYGGCQAIKCNVHEGRRYLHYFDHVNPTYVAQSIADELRCVAIVTCGDQGMFCAFPHGGYFHVPAVPVDNVRDVCGAGDTVLAALGVAIAGGYTWHAACEIATRAAAEQIQSIGISPVSLTLQKKDLAAG